MGSKRVGLARTQALIDVGKLIVGSLGKRELNLADTVLKGQARKHRNITANTTLAAVDSGAIIKCNPAGTTLIQLPSVEDVDDGWYVTVIIDEADGGTLDQKVNIGTASGEFFTGCIWCNDGDGNSFSNGTSNDFITCATASQSGLRFEIHSDGSTMHATGWAVDATDTKFADDAG